MRIVRKLLLLLVFLAGVGAVFVPLSYMMRPADGANEEIRNRITGFYAEPEDSLDVVVLGSSAVYRYINNPLLWKEQEITSYNFATPGLNIFLLEYLVEEIEKTQSPQVLLIDARKFILTEDSSYKKNRFQQLVSNLKYSKNRCDIIDRMIENPIERIYYYFDIMMYHDNWEHLTAESIKYADNESVHLTKGWDVVTKTTALEAVDMSEVNEEEPLSAVAEETLISLLKKCQQKQMEVLFLATPWQIGKTNQRQSNYMKRIVQEYGFNYLDMNKCVDEIGIDFSNDFYNERHVNAVGAKKVTKYLGEYLKTHYEFDLKKSDEVRKSWNLAVELLQEEKK